MSKRSQKEKVIPLDLDPILGRRIKNRISKIGVELEGGWLNVPEGYELERDGSVFAEYDLGHFSRKGFPDYRFGEIPLGPMQVISFPYLMRKTYPTIIDKSCGMHIHMSFDHYNNSGGNKHPMWYYGLLMEEVYQETVIEYLTRWAKGENLPQDHPIWERLAGNNPYCQKKFWPNDQIASDKDHDRNRHGHRYTIINFAHKSHKTIECRVLSMFADVEQAIRAVKAFIDITNACFVVLSKKPKRYGQSLTSNDVESVVEYIEEIL